MPMDYKEFIEMVLSEVCADDRIKKGIFEIENPEHLVVLREYVVNHTDNEFADILFEELVDEGNYPERQAYNDNGILVTFPDPESKKAAIERGTHHENPPSGASTNDDEEPDEDVENVFSNTETPEEEEERKKQELELTPSGTDITPDDIQLRYDSSESSKEKHRLYDILKNIKTSKDDDDIEDVQGEDGETIQLDQLHPTVLFALSEKWVFDKSGDWYDENGKFRGDTDLRGQVHPSRYQDKEKMMQWISDYEKRKAGIDIPDEIG